MTLLISFLLLALIISFCCSMWEAVLLSVTPSYVTRALKQGGATGRLLAEFKRDIDRPLSAILTLNTIAHTVGAIGVGAQANLLFGSAGLVIFGLPLSYEALIAAGATLAILVFSEIIPKTLGANFWERFVPITVFCLKGLIILLYPLVKLSELITHFVKNEKGRPVFSRADFLAMTDLGEEEGRLAPGEAQVVRNLLGLRELRVKDIMTPRIVLVAADADDTVGDFLKRSDIAPFSRFPIYKDSIDEIDGVLLKDEVLAAAARDEHDRRLGELTRPARFVLNRMHLPVLLRELVSSRSQMAVVIDEYGVTQGVVSFEDVIETLLGMDVMDEADEIPNLRELARSRGARIRIPLDELD